jgi:hypothetical protein
VRPPPRIPPRESAIAVLAQLALLAGFFLVVGYLIALAAGCSAESAGRVECSEDDPVRFDTVGGLAPRACIDGKWIWAGPTTSGPE